jgi:DNA-binding winged helix-turn-helix (wHTH) protein
MKHFGPFRLDTVNQCLWRDQDTGGEERLLLPPRAFAVLFYLLEHPGRLITHDELLDAVWSDVVVQPEALKSQILEVRHALGDDSKNPHYIETRVRRGYRFIASVREAPERSFGIAIPHSLVGRDHTLAEMRSCLKQVSRGQRQIVFVTGDPGIGKTAVVDEFARTAATDLLNLHIAHGQCIEGYGGTEPYYPMLDALGQLCRGPAADPIIKVLATQAPTWLVQFPALMNRERRETLQQEILGATRERMLREIGAALETITAEITLLLIFEDLQWVDHSTVDLMSALARRRAPAKLMLLGTSRPADQTPSNHSFRALRQDLRMHQLCREIEIEPLSEAEVAQYLSGGSSEGSPPEGLAALIHRHCGGNPMFMVAALEHLKLRGLISTEKRRWQLQVRLQEIKLGVPESLRQMIEAQLERLSDEEQRALEVASVAGATFSASTSAAALNTSEEDLEVLYETLARRQRTVRPAGVERVPDGGISAQYEFVHDLYREVLYSRQPSRSRSRLHLRIGERLEALYTRQPSDDLLQDRAAELAHHFEHGMEWVKAIRYTQLASDLAIMRLSPGEAKRVLNHGLSLVENLPSELRANTELPLLERAALIALATHEPAAVERYDLLARRAEHYGMQDVLVQALLDQAYPLSWTDITRCKKVLDRAIQLNRLQKDPLTRSKVEADCHFWRLWAEGWNDDNANIFRDAGREIERSGDPFSLAWYRVQQALLYHACSQYERCRSQIEHEFAALMKEATGCSSFKLTVAIKLTIAKWGAYHLVRPWSAIFLGEWGKADQEFSEGIASQERNAAQYQVSTLRLYRAWGWVIAHDYESAIRVCEALTPGLRDDVGETLPALLPAEERIRLITLGAAEAGLLRFQQALAHLEAARQQLSDHPVVLNWYWTVAVEWVLAKIHEANGDLGRANRHAQAMRELAMATAEMTWRALALETAARVAALRDSPVESSGYIEEALTLVSKNRIPVAAWQVHATASRLHEFAGRAQLAELHRKCSREAVLKLANSLPSGHSLRHAFLSASSIAYVLCDNAGTSRTSRI